MKSAALALVVAIRGAKRRYFSVVLTTLLSGCANDAARAPAGSLPAGAIARCGSEIVSADEASRADPHALIADACFAAEARRLGYADRYDVRRTIVALEARAVLEALAAAEAGPATADELAAIRALHFRELDRPEGAHVIHAVVIADEHDAAKHALAEQVAKAIAAATKGSVSADDFKARASAVARDGLDVRVENLPAMDAEGRALEGEPASFAKPFAAAALGLTKTNDEVGPVASTFGFHVIHLIERTPAHRLSDDELRAIAPEEILSTRRHAALKKHLADLRAATPPSIERSTDELLAHIDAPRR